MPARQTYTQKTFDLGNGQFRLEAHIGHIHYRDKLGDGSFKPIDWTLTWDAGRSGWTFANHSYRPLIPEYADGWCEFRDLFHGKDQTIRFRAVAGHVPGVLLPNLPGISGANCVLYTDAFGSGRDLIYAFSRHALHKLVRIRLPYPTVDTRFDFEFSIPVGLKVYRGDTKTSLTELKLTLTNTLTDDKRTLIGLEQGDGQEWFSYLRSFRVWDSNPDRDLQKRQIAKVSLFRSGGKSFLRKTIPASFFAGAFGDVLTDTTTSYYAGAGDGQTEYFGSSWAEIHDATNGNGFNYTLSSTSVGARNNVFGWAIDRVFFPIDTSGIPDAAVITAADFNGYVTSVSDGDNDGNDFIVVVGPTTQASPTSLVTEDYDQCGAVSNPTEKSARKDLTGLATGQYHVWSLTDLTLVNKTSYTLLGLRGGHDALNDPITVLTDNSLTLATSDATGTTQDPYLAVTYTVTRTITPVTAALIATLTRTIASVTAALSGTFTRSATATAALSGTLTRTITTVTAALSGTFTRSITPATAALQATLARTLGTVTTALQSTATRTVGTVTMALSGTLTRTVTTTAALSGILSRTITSVTVALQSTATRTITTVTAALQSTLTRTVTSVTAALSGTFTRTVAATGALLSTLTRTITTVTASLVTVKTRTITAVTGALQSTLTRTIGTVTGALSSTLARTVGTVTASLTGVAAWAAVTLTATRATDVALTATRATDVTLVATAATSVELTATGGGS